MMQARTRIYDAVGPETLTMKELLQMMATFHGRTLQPVHVNYYNMERILNVASLGNYNRQFVSILRSEQDIDLDTPNPISTITAPGNPIAFQQLLHKDATLCKIEDAFTSPSRTIPGQTIQKRRNFPLRSTVKWVTRNPGVVRPGLALGMEILRNFCWPHYQKPFLAEERAVKEGLHDGGGGGEGGGEDGSKPVV